MLIQARSSLWYKTNQNKAELWLETRSDNGELLSAGAHITRARVSLGICFTPASVRWDQEDNGKQTKPSGWNLKRNASLITYFT